MIANPPDTPCCASQVGQTWEREEVLTASPLQNFAALLNKPCPTTAHPELPPLAHWLYFLRWVPQALLGPDGHPRCGEFKPPAHLPRRMWGGGLIEFFTPLHVGTRVTRRSTVVEITQKEGRSGSLMLVALRHELFGADGLAIRERQDLVYRAPSGALTASPTRLESPERSVDHQRDAIFPDPLLLFRFSALTCNSHRIHYDRDYCRDVEGYPGLLVQGPLIAMLMMEQVLTEVPRGQIESYQFRNHLPLFDGAPFTLDVSTDHDRVTAHAIDSTGRRAASATAVLRGRSRS